MGTRKLVPLCVFLFFVCQKHFAVASEDEFVGAALVAAGPVLKVAAPILLPAAKAILKLAVKPGGDAPPVDPAYDGRDDEKMDKVHNLDRDPEMRAKLRDLVGDENPVVRGGTHREENGNVRTTVEINGDLILQAVKKTGNGFNIAKVAQMIDGGTVIGDFMNFMKGLDTAEAIAEALESGVLAVDVSEKSRICDGKVEWEESYVDERHRILGDLGIKVDNLQGIGNFGINVGPELERRSLDFDSTARGTSKCRIGLFTVSIQPSPGIKDYLHEAIVEAWESLPTDSSRPGWIRHYINFFNRYGTHVVRAAEFGGLVKLTATVDKSIMKAIDSYALSAGVQAFLMGVNPKEQGSMKGSLALKKHSESANFDVRVKGGDEALVSMSGREPIGAERIGQWVNSLQKSVARLTTELGTIDEFMLVAYGGVKAPLEHRQRAKIFKMVASNTYMTLAEKAVQFRVRIGSLNGMIEKTAGALKTVQKQYLMESTRLLGEKLKHHPSKGAFYSAHCRNGHYLCTERCKIQSTLEALEQLFFDVNIVPGGLEACMVPCYEKFRDPCKTFPIAKSEFASGRDSTIGEDDEEYRKGGIVYKRTQNDGWKRFKPQRWMKRYLKLHGDTMSYSRVKMTGEVPGPALKKKIIRFKDVYGIVKSLPLKLADGWGFQVVTQERVFYFMCESEEDRDQWVGALMAHHKFFSGGAAEKDLSPSFNRQKIEIVNKKIEGRLMDLTESSGGLRGSTDSPDGGYGLVELFDDSDEMSPSLSGDRDSSEGSQLDDAQQCWDMCMAPTWSEETPLPPPSSPDRTAEALTASGEGSTIPELDPSEFMTADHDNTLSRLLCLDEDSSCKLAFDMDGHTDDDDSDAEDDVSGTGTDGVDEV